MKFTFLLLTFLGVAWAGSNAGGDSPADARMAGCPPPVVIKVKQACPPAPVCDVCDKPVVCAPCEETPACPAPLPPVIVTRDVVRDVVKLVPTPPVRQGEWFGAASILNVANLGLGGGVGYKWKNGIALLGQVTYSHGLSVDANAEAFAEAEAHATCSGGNGHEGSKGRCKPDDAYDYDYQSAYSHKETGKVGGILTLLFPLHRRGK